MIPSPRCNRALAERNEPRPAVCAICGTGPCPGLDGTFEDRMEALAKRRAEVEKMLKEMKG